MVLWQLGYHAFFKPMKVCLFLSQEDGRVDGGGWERVEVRWEKGVGGERQGEAVVRIKNKQINNKKEKEKQLAKNYKLFCHSVSF